MGVSKGIGVTHQSILLAHCLKSQGYRVAVVEMNHKKDFIAIEAAYEGMGYQSRGEKFTIQNVSYYGFVECLNWSHIVALPYDFVLLDCGSQGNLMKTHLSSDFPLLICQGIEWKVKELEQFLGAHSYSINQRWHLMVPFSKEQELKTIKKIWPYGVSALPFIPDPFCMTKKQKKSLDHIIG